MIKDIYIHFYYYYFVFFLAILWHLLHSPALVKYKITIAFAKNAFFPNIVFIIILPSPNHFPGLSTGTGTGPTGRVPTKKLCSTWWTFWLPCACPCTTVSRTWKNGKPISTSSTKSTLATCYCGYTSSMINCRIGDISGGAGIRFVSWGGEEEGQYPFGSDGEHPYTI